MQLGARRAEAALNRRRDLREGCSASSANIYWNFETGWETLLSHAECLLSANIQVQVLIDRAVMDDGVPYISLKAGRVILLQSCQGVEATPHVLSDQSLLSSPHFMGRYTC